MTKSHKAPLLLVTFSLWLLVSTLGYVHAQQPGELVGIPGSRVSFVPPETFELSDTSSILVSTQAGAWIDALEVWPHAYAEISDLFQAGSQPDGVFVTERREVMTDGYPGFLALGTLVRDGHAKNYFWVLVFRAEEFTGAVKVTATIPDVLSDQAVLASLTSVKIQSTEEFNLRDQLAYSIQESEDFELYWIRHGSAVTLKSRSDENANFEVRMVPHLTCSPRDRSHTVFSKSDMHDIAFVRVSNIAEPKEINVDSLSGVEYLAEGVHTKSKQELVVYHSILSDDCDYYRFIGYAPRRERNRYLSVFRRITESFARK